MLIDYHLHNRFSPDSEELTEKIIEQAIEKGMKSICITNHAEWHGEGAELSTFDLDEAIERFKNIKDELDTLRPNYPEIDIRFGVELEYYEGRMDELTQFVEQVPLDFVLGSVHIVKDTVIASTKFAHTLYKQLTEEEAYHTYFDQMEKLIEWGHFDVVAHFDVFKKAGIDFYGPFDPVKYKSRIIPILKKMKDKGIGLELNTKCLESKCQEISPHSQILKWAVEVGIKNYTLSSDAHKAKNVSVNIKKAAEIAKEVGIEAVSTYKSRDFTLNAI